MESSLKNKIKGVLFGGAIGDTLGLGSEFMSKTEVQKYYPNGLYDYSQIVQDYHRCRWQRGECTDDTEMMICIVNAIIKDKDIKLSSIAQNFKNWFNENPLGIGKHTYNVLSFADYVKEPFRAAEIIWKLGKKRNAANGGIMRTSIIGLWNKNVGKNAEEVCKLTHYDSRCIGSCVIISQLIHSLVYNDEIIPLKQLITMGDKYDERIREYLLLAQSDNADSLFLDQEREQGYTLKTMAAAIWCLYHCSSFEEGLLTVVNAGGDADTNAAVACSLLGAKYGYNTIPKNYINGLIRKKYLMDIADKLIAILISHK